MVSGNKNLNEGTATLVLVARLWEKLRGTHAVRVVK